MQQTTVFNSPPPFVSEMKSEVNPVDDSVQAAPPAQPVEPSSDYSPSVDFIPFIDEAEEKRKFWKTVIITMGIFLVMSIVIIGVVVSQRLSQPPTRVNIQYLDGGDSDSKTAIVITRRPTKTPTPTSIVSTIPSQATLTHIPSPSQRQPTIPYIMIYKTTSSPTATPRSNTPTPTLSGTPPVMTPTNTPVPILLPTVTPTPTPYLYYPSATFNFGTTLSDVITTDLVNIGGSNITITNMTMAVGGSTNPFTFSNTGGCLYFASTPTPYILRPNERTCVGVAFSTSTPGTFSNSAIIWWNSSSMSSIALVGTRPSPTPTNTPTSTPTPTLTSTVTPTP